MLTTTPILAVDKAKQIAEDARLEILKQSIKDEVWSPDLPKEDGQGLDGKIIKGMYTRYMEAHRDANPDEVDNALDYLEADYREAHPEKYEEDDKRKEPKFGDFNGLLLRIQRVGNFSIDEIATASRVFKIGARTEKNTHLELTVDRHGVNIYTGKVYPLFLEELAKITKADKETKAWENRRTIISATYDHNAPPVERQWDYEGLVVSGAYCLWLGARKAEKSLFALRKAMHDACGADWLNHRNMLGPVKVLYFDAENDKAEVDERYREIITEFDPEQQKLIKQNLDIKLGKEFKKQGKDIEFDKTELWDSLPKKNIRIVYLDCWYQLQSIKAADDETQKKALEMFEKYFQNTTLFLLHHTGRESQESLAKKEPLWLRVIGAERWSNKSSGGNVLTKKADLIICQEKFVVRDAEGVENDSCIDIQAYSRSGPSSILLSFEPVFGEEIDGKVFEYKYRRKMIVNLSSLAANAARKLKGKGPWKSQYDLAKEIGMVGGKQYKAIAELRVKGFIEHNGGEFFLNDSGFDEAVKLSAENPVAIKSASTLLDSLLIKPDGMPSAGVPYENIKAMAEVEGIDMESINRAKRRRKIQVKEIDGKVVWYLPSKIRKAMVNLSATA